MILIALLAAAALSTAAHPVVVATIFTAERSAALKPPVDAQVAAVLVREGARVHRGAILVQLDDRQQRARVALAATSTASTAEIGTAGIRSREANARLANAQRAATSGAIADWELRQTEAAAAQAAQEVQMALDRRSVERRRLSVEQSVLEGLRIRAPFDGRVTRINARPGASVRPADTIAVVTDLHVLRGEAFVQARFYPLLKVDSTYEVIFGEGFGKNVRVTLTYVDPVINAGSFRAVFQLRNTDEFTPSGLEGRIVLKRLQ